MPSPTAAPVPRLTAGPSPLPRPAFRRPHLLSSHRWRPRRRAAWIAAGVLVVVGFLQGARGGATDGLSTVAVATRALAPGEVIGVGDVDWRPVPGGAVGDGAFDGAGDPPVGRTVVAAVEAGEPVLAVRLAPPGAAGAEALAGPGRRAVRLGDDAVAPAVEAGDRVDLYGAGEGLGGPVGRAAPVAEDAVVLAVDDEGITVAVATDDAAGAAGAVLDGRVVVVVRGPPATR